MKASNQRPMNFLFSFVLSAIFLTIWEIMVRVNHIPIYLLPAPSRAFQVLAQQPGYFAEALSITLIEAFIGLALGFLAGFSIASLINTFPQFEDGVMTLAILIKSTPLVAIAPLLTIWLGFGVFPKIIITGLLTFFPILINVLVGFQSGNRDLMDLMMVFKSSKWQTYSKLKVFLSLPFIFAALRVSAPLALVGAVVAEWTGASGGLGRVMWLSYANLNLPPLFASIFILSLSGMAIYSLIVQIEQKIIRWNQFQVT
jgi:ABC-type nitrate/sulfonate/bicarbonate transport system permease component